MRILLTPIDERPCNYNYPQHLASNSLDIILPSRDLLGDKKRPADTEGLWQFIFKHVDEVDGLILSTDLLLYGGLIPSRLHHLQQADRDIFFENLLKLCRSFSGPIYMSSMIMRNQQQNYDDEEPGYYLEYGQLIFRRSVLMDKKERQILNYDEVEELKELNEQIPQSVINDLENRRAFNLNVTKELLQFVKTGKIEFMVIPQDDSYPYGYTALDQKEIIKLVDDYQIQEDLKIYPGADEVGLSLMTRMVLALKKKKIKLYVEFSNSQASSIVPLYEDRMMESSLKSHLYLIGAQIVSLHEADAILFINGPSDEMKEAFVQLDTLQYDVNNLADLNAERIKHLLSYNLPVAIVDKAFVNGGDINFVKALDRKRILAQIKTYKAWNTYCNSLGSALADLILAKKSNLQYDLLEGLIYQSIVRWQVVNKDLKALGCNYFDITNAKKTVAEIVSKRMLDIHEKLLSESFKTPSNLSVSFPWERMFEIKIDSIE